MQTFLPYSDFSKSARCLDYRRLGKQRVEAYQLYRIVSGVRTIGGWINHPATKMWSGYPEALALYQNVMIDEWIDRGYQKNMKYLPINEITFPWWLGKEDLHSSHRSNLLKKDPLFYGRYNWKESRDLNYVWYQGK